MTPSVTYRMNSFFFTFGVGGMEDLRPNVGLDRRTRSECAQRTDALVRPCRRTCWAALDLLSCYGANPRTDQAESANMVGTHGVNATRLATTGTAKRTTDLSRRRKRITGHTSHSHASTSHGFADTKSTFTKNIAAQRANTQMACRTQETASLR